MISFTIVIALIALIIQVQASFEPVQVMCEVNGKMVPAIVDTGAEISVMSTSCARRCGLWQAIDTQHSGRAIGVGTSDIVGGIEGLGIRIGPLSFQNKISILRNSNHRCDFIIGLDILKRFNCDILLRERVVKMYVRGNEVRIPLVQADGAAASITDLSGHYQTSFAKQQQAQSKEPVSASLSSPAPQSSPPSLGANSPSTASTAVSGGRHPAFSALLDEEEDEEFEDENEYDAYMSQRHAPIGVSAANSAPSEATSRRVEYVVNRHCYDHNTDGRRSGNSRTGGISTSSGSLSSSISRKSSSSSGGSRPFSAGFGGAGAASQWTTAQTRHSPSTSTSAASNRRSTNDGSGRRPFVDPDLEKYMHREALRRQEKVLQHTGHASSDADVHRNDVHNDDNENIDEDAVDDDEDRSWEDDADDLREDEDYEQFHERLRDRSISMEGV